MVVKYLSGINRTVLVRKNVTAVTPVDSAENAVIEYLNSNNVPNSEVIESKRLLSITIEVEEK